MKNERKLSIALVSDYVFPKSGGVESHIYSLGELLVKRGHRVVIVTHAYGDRIGVRYLGYGFKLYYLPLQPIPPARLQVTLPGFFTAFPYLRNIFIREEIDLVHSHASLSALGLEALFHARTMGLRAVLTEHSLFSLGKADEIWGNKIVKGCLADVDAVISVSHTCKANVVLRTGIQPSRVHVIPNAITSEFKPVESERSSRGNGRGLATSPQPQTVTIVCISRLVYRKGIDLLIGALPKICMRYPNVNFIIGGDGPKIVQLDQMLDKHQDLLRGRVTLLGPLRHDKVLETLHQGQIFLNSSLTEAFGIGILEAACAGLFVVSTKVGGIPEVLPDQCIEYCEPNVQSIVDGVGRAVTHILSNRHDPIEAHKLLQEVYSWKNIALRTENVYYQSMDTPMVTSLERLRRCYATGQVFGKIMCVFVAFDIILLFVLDWLFPRELVDIVPRIDIRKFDQFDSLEE